MSMIYIVNLAINVLIILIFVRVILSWVPELTWRYRQISRPLERITDPFIEPFRRIVSPMKTGGLDISPMLAVIALAILRRILLSLLAG